MTDTFLWLIGWVNRMVEKYDGICYEKNGKLWDWGQAACRELCGSDWFRGFNELYKEIEKRGYLNEEEKQKLIDWENGSLPDWFDPPNVKVKPVEEEETEEEEMKRYESYDNDDMSAMEKEDE